MNTAQLEHRIAQTERELRRIVGAAPPATTDTDAIREHLADATVDQLRVLLTLLRGTDDTGAEKVWRSWLATRGREASADEQSTTLEAVVEEELRSRAPEPPPLPPHLERVKWLADAEVEELRAAVVDEDEETAARLWRRAGRRQEFDVYGSRAPVPGLPEVAAVVAHSQRGRCLRRLVGR